MSYPIVKFETATYAERAAYLTSKYGEPLSPFELRQIPQMSKVWALWPGSCYHGSIWVDPDGSIYADDYGQGNPPTCLAAKNGFPGVAIWLDKEEK